MVKIRNVHVYIFKKKINSAASLLTRDPGVCEFGVRMVLMQFVPGQITCDL